MIQYDLVLKSPQAHVVQVKQTLCHESSAPLLLTMPSWLPGSYTLRDFSKNIMSIHAYVLDTPTRALQVRKQDSHTYQIEAFEGHIVIEYEVYCWDRSVRGAHFDDTHGFFNGSSLFLYPNLLKNRPIQLSIQAPERTYQNKPWQVATTMPALDVDAHGFGVYQAVNYEALIDFPIEMGCFQSVDFDVNQVPHQIVLTGQVETDLQVLANDVAKICDYQNKLFGDVPFEKYLFLLTVMDDGYGGLEHKDSTALMCFKKCLLVQGKSKESKDYRQLLGLISHEYFHAWNVKRIKPLEFYNLDLTRPHYTNQLWAFEGITSYYDDLALLRSTCITSEQYLELLGETITKVHQSYGHLKQTVRESSFDAWTKFYHPNENSQNCLVSYYTKGSLCALLFDLMIRKNTDNQKSLDDVMRRLWVEYGKKDIGVPDGCIEKMMIELGGDDMQALVTLALNTTTPLPLESMLSEFGIELNWDYPKKPANLQEPYEPVSLGIQYTGDTQLVISHVAQHGAAQEAGLSSGDVLIAINHCQVTAKNLEHLLHRIKVGESITAHVFREERMLTFTVVMQSAKKSKATLSFVADASKEIIDRQQSWLAQG